MDRIWEISRRKSWKLLAWLHGNSFLIPWDQLRGFDIWWFDMIWCLLMKQDMWSSCKNGCWTLRSDDLTHHWNWSSESLEQVCMSVELQEDWESCFCVTFWDMMLVLGVNSKHILSETKCMQHSCTLCSASKWVAKTAFQFAKMLRTCPVRHHWTLFSKSDFQLCKHHKWDRRGFLNWKRGRAWPSHIAVIRVCLVLGTEMGICIGWRGVWRFGKSNSATPGICFPTLRKLTDWPSLQEVCLGAFLFKAGLWALYIVRVLLVLSAQMKWTK